MENNHQPTVPSHDQPSSGNEPWHQPVHQQAPFVAPDPPTPHPLFQPEPVVAEHHHSTPITDTATPSGVNPQPVVKVLSPAGVEYVFLMITLFTGEFGLSSILISLFNGETNFSVLAYPLALLVVTFPIFAWLFLRLKKGELKDPDRRLDASKRRSTQFIQIANFIVTFFTTIGFVGAIFAKLGGQLHSSIFKIFLDALVIWLIGGGTLAYYWRDEHKKRASRT
jgi:hypothetical protein